jgi:uncharacterized SAM-binding protein YcdF (DUF218 family)
VKLFLSSVALIVLVSLAVVVNRLSIPDHNTAATHFDTLIVLGTPSNRDGSASADQRARVSEAVREFKSGVAPAIIMTGGAAHNKFVEAHAMAIFAIKQGVPASAVIEEGEARNTIQNIFYSSQIMHAHSWHSAEVVSSAAHIKRAAMILQTFKKSQPTLAIDWRTHPAPWPPEKNKIHRLFLNIYESSRCLELRIFGFPHSRFLP